MRKFLTAFFVFMLPLVLIVCALLFNFMIEETYSKTGGGEHSGFSARHVETV